MSTQLTIIIVVALICITAVRIFYYSSEVRRLKSMFYILRELIAKNESLNKEINQAYEGWFGEIRNCQEKAEIIINDLYELQQKLKS